MTGDFFFSFPFLFCSLRKHCDLQPALSHVIFIDLGSLQWDTTSLDCCYLHQQNPGDKSCTPGWSLRKKLYLVQKKRNDLNFLEQSDFFKVLQFFLLCLQYFLLLVLYQSALYFTFGIKHALSFPDLNLLQGNSNHWFDPVLPKGSAWNCTCCWSAPTFGVNGQCNQLLKNIADRQRKALGLFFCYCS